MAYSETSNREARHGWAGHQIVGGSAPLEQPQRPGPQVIGPDRVARIDLAAVNKLVDINGAVARITPDELNEPLHGAFSGKVGYLLDHDVDVALNVLVKTTITVKHLGCRIYHYAHRSVPTAQ